MKTKVLMLSFLLFAGRTTALDYSTFIGGNLNDSGNSLALGSNENVYVSGYTESYNFPVTSGCSDTTYNLNSDIFVSSFNSANTLNYSTFIGGFFSDFSNSVKVDSLGNAYITGTTESFLNFPITSGVFNTTFTGTNDAFALKLNPSGSALVYSTFINEVTANSNVFCEVYQSELYFVGSTSTTTFPITSGIFDATFNGVSDIFLTKLNQNASALGYSTFFGGNGEDVPKSIFVDTQKNCYFAGYTTSNNFPTSQFGYDKSYNGTKDAFVTRISQNADSLKYSSFLGGATDDFINSIKITSDKEYNVTGSTLSSNFPITSGVLKTSISSQDIFLTKLNSNLSTLVYSTFFGGNGSEAANSFTIDKNEVCYLTGYTTSSNFPITNGAFSTSFSGIKDVFVSKLGFKGTTLFYSTFLGGSAEDFGNDLRIDENGKFYLTGETASDNFPLQAASFDPSFNGNKDVFLAKFSFELTPPAPITDLEFIGFTVGNPTFKFTATGDDSTSGTAKKYFFAYSSNQNTLAKFSDAAFVAVSAAPQLSGSTETIVVNLPGALNTLFYFRVLVFDNDGNYNFSNITSNFGKAKITSVTDVPNDNGGFVRLTFQQNPNEYTQTALKANYYNILRKAEQTGSNWQTIGTVPAFGDQSYIFLAPTLADSNSTGTNSFQFAVVSKAIFSNSVSSVSNVVSCYSKDNIFPQAPTNQIFTSNVNGTVTATWNTVYAPDLAAYRIYAKLNNQTYSLVAEVQPSQNPVQSYDFTPFPKSTGYTVRSVDENGNENLFNLINNLKIEASGNDVILTWSAPESATSYKIYCSTKPDLSGSVLLGTTSVNELSPVFTDFGAILNSEQRFYFVTYED